MLYYLGKITDNEGYQHLANDLYCSYYEHGDNQRGKWHAENGREIHHDVSRQHSGVHGRKGT